MSGFEDFSVRSLRVSAVLTLPIALVIARWFRSGAVLWMLAVNLSVDDLHRFLDWGNYWPADGFFSVPPSKDFFLEHPFL